MSRPASPEDVGAICAALHGTWFGTNWGDVPFFTGPHFRGYHAVLVQRCRLAGITRDELEEVRTDAWRACIAKSLVGRHLGDERRGG